MTAGGAPRRRSVGAPRHALEPSALSTFVALGAIVALDVLLRFVWPGVRPGYDWDEPVYASIGANVAAGNGVMLKPQLGMEPSVYLSHPPFYFWLLGGWFRLFGTGIAQARMLAATSSVVTLILLFFFMKSLRGRRVAIQGTLLLAADGWLVFTNRVSWFENFQFILITLALMAYWKSLKSNAKHWYVIAGLMMGGVFVFKQVGGYIMLIPVMNFLLTRTRDGDEMLGVRREPVTGHLLLMASSLAVVIVYFAGMALSYPGDAGFLSATKSQLLRTSGATESPGTINSLSDVITPLVQQYSIFVGTLVVAGVAVCVLVWRIVGWLRGGLESVRSNSLLFSWALTATTFFVVISLKMPHYFLLLLIPLTLYLVSEMQALYARKYGHLVVAVFLAVAVAASSFAFVERIALRQDNALAQVADYARSSIPVDAVVIADETVGSGIAQPYCTPQRAGIWKDCERASYVIVYESQTRDFPTNGVVDALLQSAQKLVVFTGFKEVITVYRVVRDT